MSTIDRGRPGRMKRLDDRPTAAKALGGRSRQTPALPEPRSLPIDVNWMRDTLLELLRVPSPTGRTDAVMQLVGDVLNEIGIPFELTRRGSLVATLDGDIAEPDRAVVCHADTIGAMVKTLKENGRLSIIPVGSHSARFAEGARVLVFCDDNRSYTGTVLPLKASGHAFGDEIDTQGVGWDQVEVRIDQKCQNRTDLAALGLQVGDFVAFETLPVVTQAGFIKSRHLDGKAGVAIALASMKAVVDSGCRLPHRTHLLVTITEEVGHGASHGLAADTAEMVSLDNAVCAPGQQSLEDGVTIAMSDMTGPFDFHLTRRLCRVANANRIAHARDTFKWYRSDIAAALEAGAATRAALIAFGVDASHGHERTHIDSLRACAELVTAYLQTDLTFARWDAAPSGPLEDFPSNNQPAPREKSRLVDTVDETADDGLDESAASDTSPDA